MYGLIEILYDNKKQKSFKSLYGDSSLKDQMLLRATIAEALKDCPKNIPSNGIDWILCTLASYQKSEEDTFRIFQGVSRHIDHISFGLFTEDIKWKETNQVADECLVGLSFFRRKMEMMHERRAAPSIEYYKKAGELAFHRLGFESISEDFNGWINFIEKELSTTSID